MEQAAPPRPRAFAAHRASLTLAAALALAGCGSEPAIPGGATQSAADAVAGEATPQTSPSAEISGPQRNILAFGDSLFAGYNVPKAQSYPAQLQGALRRAGVDADVTNAGVSGDTSAAGRQRFAFTLRNQPRPPDLLILELGGNDLLRGLSPDETRANLAAIIEQARAADIPVLLMGMRAPANYGGDYLRRFDAIYPSLAKEYGVKLVPNWIEDVAGRPQLIQDDRIHPTVEGIGVLVNSTLDQVRGALPKG